MIPTELSHKLRAHRALVLFLSLILTTSTLLISQAQAPEDYSVIILDFSFNPETLCIEKGDTVVWTNNAPMIYTLWFVFAENKSTYLLSDPIPPGQSWSHLFSTPAKLLCYSFERLWVTGKLRIFTIFGDANGDTKVNVSDLYEVGRAYESDPSSPNWNPDCDFNGDSKIDESDLGDLSENYGKIDP